MARCPNGHADCGASVPTPHLGCSRPPGTTPTVLGARVWEPGRYAVQGAGKEGAVRILERIVKVVAIVTIVVVCIAIDVFIFLHWGLGGLIAVALIETVVIPVTIMLVAGVGAGIGFGVLTVGRAVAGLFRRQPREPARRD